MRQSKKQEVSSWQEFEEATKEILEAHEFKTAFRVVFKDEKGRAEIDVVAERYGFILAIDAKRYTHTWYRASALRKEAKKHAERCKRYEKIVGKKVVPVIVSLIDDSIVEHEGCIVVPFHAFNDFLLNLEAYIDELIG
ncbi:restriction endonuclease [Archaeoglobus veneficus]|uniref:restriction endonuclease n=1 Tax=Archaeoglobus veneficus TaxID=58290 RepID=UPI001E5CF56A|nr:hypothetical protein [Archaeoglobus veneficus]